MIASREGDEIHVAVQLPGGRALDVTASLAKGGNIVTYEWPGNPDAPPNAFRYSRRGSYEWTKTPDGKWIPKHVQFEHFVPGRPAEVVWEFTNEILEFEPSGQPDRLFDFRSVTPVPGTDVFARDRTGRSITHRGGRDGAVNQATLDSIACEIGAGSLAAPEN